MAEPVHDLERALRLHRLVSAMCAEACRECERMRSVCADQLLETAAMREQLGAMRRTPDATSPPDR